MSMQRFVAATARDCLRKVKESLGPDAIVVSNKPVAGGVEIMAMTADGFEALSRQLPPSTSSTTPAIIKPAADTFTPLTASSHAQSQANAQVNTHASELRAHAMRQAYNADTNESRLARNSWPQEDDYQVSLSHPTGSTRNSAQQAQPVHVSPPRWPNQTGELATSPSTSRSRLRPLPGRTPASPVIQPGNMRSAAAPKITPAAQPARTTQVAAGDRSRMDSLELPPAHEKMQNQVSELMGEMHTIKALLERQLAGFAWGELTREAPNRALATAEMLDAGFSTQLARRLCQDLPEEFDLVQARKWLQNALNRQLRTLSSDNDIIDRGGVYALVGPTGVGKTTTTAKLAARCVVRYGADKLALLTTDGYRIGAHEQLRIYGRILGVPTHVVRDGDDLRHTLSDLRDKHMVLIDTVGMNQRDRMVTEQAAMLMRAGEINRLLLLNATSRGDTLDDVIRAYAGEDLAGVILSKVDETASLAPALDAVIRHGLLLCYIANGQRVPEDMHLPNRSYLMHRAFKLPTETSAHRLQTEDAGLLLSTANRRASGDQRG